MRVLMVGFGAVGQVFGLFLQKAGVELGCHDRPAATEKLKQALEHEGLSLFQVQSRGKPPLAHRLDNFQVLADITECQRFKPDLIWFTVPSPVYYSEWFRDFLQQVPAEHVACFTPEGRRGEFFLPGTGRDVVFGGVTFMAWQGDLDGGGGKANGVNFWLPPLSIPLQGTEKSCNTVKQLLQKGGFKVTIGKADSSQQASTTAVMTAYVAGLELASWSLKAFRNSPWLARSSRAAREAALSQVGRPGLSTKISLGLLCSTAVFSLISFLLPLLFPFEIEKYLKFHYLKTRDQTLALLEIFAKDEEKQGAPSTYTRMLLKGLLGSTRTN
jgi:hypothetical protein